MNKTKCEDCVHYDPQKKFSPKGERDSWYGWCKEKSIYPHTAPDGQTIPLGVKRAAEGERPNPVIVYGIKVKVGCTDVIKVPPAKK